MVDIRYSVTFDEWLPDQDVTGEDRPAVLLSFTLPSVHGEYKLPSAAHVGNLGVESASKRGPPKPVVVFDV